MSDIQVSFSHVQLYVDHVEDYDVYQEFATTLTNGSTTMTTTTSSASTTVDSSAVFISQNRDIIKQLMAGLGFRITAVRLFSALAATNTKSMLVSSHDPNGVQFIITALDPASPVPLDEFSHFDAAHVHHFFEAHAGRQGIAVLGFSVNNVDELFERYQRYHPLLILDRHDYGTMKILQVYAYYQSGTPELPRDDTAEEAATLIKSQVDVGTVLRFVECTKGTSPYESDSASVNNLPGFTSVQAKFDSMSSCRAAYCDHWVSNVHSRIGFLNTLEDVLGFVPKVDFNAGVVAAGEAQIESTVTGNTSRMRTDDPKEALRDQSQVFLPINNALSTVGHVHGFLQEIGQGVQHTASRVEDLVEFVQRANDNRKRTGEGFTFLNIPRSYYGILTERDLVEYSSVSPELAQSIMSACEARQLMTIDGALDLNVTGKEIEECLKTALQGSPALLAELQKSKANIVDTILKSRYKNLHALLGDYVSDKKYIGIVRNQVLVDIQGDDLLYQIFTCNILQ